jgi:4-amino-4-deoxy-L-arabinose transferase-like glycosyltransferase
MAICRAISRVRAASVKPHGGATRKFPPKADFPPVPVGWRAGGGVFHHDKDQPSGTAASARKACTVQDGAMGLYDFALSGGGRSATRAIPDGARRILLAVAGLTALRFALAAVLPLSFDESYFWLWSRHLAISYYDHPPMIALAIRLGTLLFGDTEFGVRFVPVLCSIGALWAVWRAAAILLCDEYAAAIACCLLSVTLMFAAESMGATPDSLVLAASAFLLWTMAKLEDTRDGRWWLAAGLAAGAALLTKYTAFFLVASVGLWLVATPRGRAWLRTPWPYAGGVLALAFLVPNLVWNASHGWISFKFQFGRVVAGQPTARYLIEFIAGQLALASPFVLVLGVAGLAREARLSRAVRPLSFAAAMVWLALAYFAIHCLHDRVQGNWPSFVYPAFMLLAASAFVTPSSGRRAESILRASRILAFPVAACILVVCYAQAFTGSLPLGSRDPIARMTATGIGPVARQISAIARQESAAGIVTTKYVVTGWLSFYLRPHIPVIPIAEDYRWLSSPRAGDALLRKPLLYVTQHPDRELALVTPYFSNVRLLAALDRKRDGVAIDTVFVYALSGFYGHAVGRLP